jgi:hypothetical protein
VDRQIVGATQVSPHPIPEGGGGSGAVEKFRVMNDRDLEDDVRAMQNDWFYAVQMSTGDTRIKVAKPYDLRVTPWEGGGFRHYFRDLNTRIQYNYPFIWVEPPRFNYNLREASREDLPNIVETQIIWPPYHTRAISFTPESIIKAAQIGEEATGIDGVEWEESDVTRVWTLLPEAFT